MGIINDEAIRLMTTLTEEANSISDKPLKDIVRTALECLPAQCWEIPSSGSKHHLADEREPWGNLRHTIRVIRLAEVLAVSVNLDQPQRDVLKAAAILHDCCKRGMRAEHDHTVEEHPMLVRNYLTSIGLITKDIYHLLAQVLECVEQHMGRWGPVKPDWMRAGYTKHFISLPFLLHAADCIEAHLPSLEVK